MFATFYTIRTSSETRRRVKRPFRQLLDLAQAARIGWIRIDFIWSWVEPVRGTRDYRVYDDLVREARGTLGTGELSSPSLRDATAAG